MSCTARKHQVRTAPRQGYGPRPLSSPGRALRRARPLPANRETSQNRTRTGTSPDWSRFAYYAVCIGKRAGQSHGGAPGARTQNPRIKSPLLYH